jgi:hypothetical protein
MRAFIADLRRRKVHRAAALYLLGGYASVEAADLLVPLLQLPGGTVRIVLVLVIIGFPFALALSWAFEITSRGLVRTPSVEVSERAGQAIENTTHPPSTDGDRTSILVAPLSNQSPDPDNEYIADGLTDEIITDLSKIASLRVIARASTMRLKGLGDSLAAKARALRVECSTGL